MSANERCPAGAPSELIAASRTIVSQPRRTARFDSRRTLAHRAIVRELNEWFGIFAYPDPAVIYAVAPSREAALDE
jgi:hypothetical protein